MNKIACHKVAESNIMPPEIAGSGHDSPGCSLKLPDPWLFDSESLVRELDRCREAALQIPTNGDANATHFGIQATVNALWTLRENIMSLRENIMFLLRLHKDGQRSVRRQHARSEDIKAKHQTVYVHANCVLIGCQ